MSKVYITSQRPEFDFAPAEDYGRLIAVWPSNAQVWGDTSHFVDDARRKLSDFEEGDFILPMGDPILSAILIAEADRRGDGLLRILKWDRRMNKTGGYRVVEVDMERQPN